MSPILRACLPGVLALAACGVGAAETSGFLQLRLTQRLHSLDACTLPACGQMVQQAQAELLYEPRLHKNLNATVRLEAKTDQASGASGLAVREAYLDWGVAANAPFNLKLGRQVVTWGVSDFLYVNDLFPKNYDSFFTGGGFDRIKQPIDALRLVTKVAGAADAGSSGATELEFVLARARADQTPLPERFAASADARHAQSADRADQQWDLALKLATRLEAGGGSWDVAAYLANFQAREQRYFVNPTGLHFDRPRTRHLGLSMTGNAAGGLAWLELAMRQADASQTGLVSRYYAGSALKLIVGYSREVAQDTSVAMQLQLESNLQRSRYLAQLAPGIRPVARVDSLVHLRLQRTWLNQTVSTGAQLFIDGEGDSHVNPFASWSPADGWTIEGGANLFSGKPDTRFGVLKDDSNLYLLGRYSF
jgi:hypothetical protein